MHTVFDNSARPFKEEYRPVHQTNTQKVLYICRHAVTNLAVCHNKLVSQQLLLAHARPMMMNHLTSRYYLSFCLFRTTLQPQKRATNLGWESIILMMHVYKCSG